MESESRFYLNLEMRDSLNFRMKTEIEQRFLSEKKIFFFNNITRFSFVSSKILKLFICKQVQGKNRLQHWIKGLQKSATNFVVVFRLTLFLF